MRLVHEYLATAPFDLYELHLFGLIVRHGSLTAASRQAGLTQSAVSRQLQGMESRLGVPLLERTTRSLRPTPAGKFLLEQSAKILGDVAFSLQRLREEFAAAPKLLRVGVSRSIGLAYLPGFFVAFQRRAPGVQLQVSHQRSQEILAAVDARELDVGLLCPPARLARALGVTHRFDDAFAVIAPPAWAPPAGFAGECAPHGLAALLDGWRWLLIEPAGNTGRRLRAWLEEHGAGIVPAMELDSFDLIINLVSLGFGASVVPLRALALYRRRRAVRLIRLAPRFSRELVVVTRRERQPPEHVARFTESVLF